MKYCVILSLILTISITASAKPRQEAPTLKKADHSKSSPGFTLAPLSGTESIVLVDSKGAVAHRWEIDATRARLLPNCNLIVIHGSTWGRQTERWKELRPIVREYDWDGAVVWEFAGEEPAHHDLRRLDNGNTIFLTRVSVAYNVKTETAQKVDSFNALFGDTAEETPLRRVQSDVILEIDPSGKLAWSWAAHEFLDLSSCGIRKCPKAVSNPRWIKAPYDWTHSNTVAIIPENRWHNEGDQRFKPGNILITARSWWSGLLIDKETKEVVWRYSGPKGNPVIKPHEFHMIPPGFPGAGNVLVFDNGGDRLRPHSIIYEVNPVTNEVVWKYQDKHFYSRAAGSVQRLANGNTLISEDVSNRIFEVTPGKEVVWDAKFDYRVNRAHRYPLGFCSRFTDLSSSELKSSRGDQQ